MNAQENSSSAVLKMLRFDHKRIGDLLFHYEQSETPSHKISFAETALNELTIHGQIEETLFYPFVRGISNVTAGLINVLASEHEFLDGLMSQLANDEEFTEEYDKVFTTLSIRLQKHIEQEETQLFSLLADADLSNVLKPMQQMREKLVAREAQGRRDFTPRSLLYARPDADNSRSEDGLR